MVKFDKSNHVHVWDHSYSTSIQSVEENCIADHSYVKNTSVTKIPVIDHSKRDHSYADVVTFGDKHKNKHVGDHSYTCTVEESGALHNKNNEKSIIPNPQIEQGDKQESQRTSASFLPNSRLMFSKPINIVTKLVIIQ